MYRYNIAKRAISLIEIPCLFGNIDQEHIINACNNATTPYGQIASISVPPRFVNLAKEQLKESAVKVSSVANFPTGKSSLARIGHDVENALENNVDEIALMLPIHEWLKNERENSLFLIERIKEVSKEKALLRIIIETDQLEKSLLIEEITNIAIENGANFIQTSSARSNEQYKVEATNVILDTIKEHKKPIGLVVTGIINSFDQILDNISLADIIMGEEWTHPSTFRIQTNRYLHNLIKLIDNMPKSQRRG